MIKRVYLTLFCAIILSSYGFTQDSDVIELQKIRFTENWFSDVDEAVENADKAYYLDLSLQKLRTFPEGIFELPNLQMLFLSYNYYAAIPNRISELTTLKVLDITGNYYMNTLPEGLWELTQLEKLIIKDHKLNASEIEKAKKKLPDTLIVVD